MNDTVTARFHTLRTEWEQERRRLMDTIAALVASNGGELRLSDIHWHNARNVVLHIYEDHKNRQTVFTVSPVPMERDTAE